MTASPTAITWSNRHERTPTWLEQNPIGRWRRFTYDELLARDKVNLDCGAVRETALITAGRVGCTRPANTGRISVRGGVKVEQIYPLGSQNPGTNRSVVGSSPTRGA